jgi:hypothetical protein
MMPRTRTIQKLLIVAFLAWALGTAACRQPTPRPASENDDDDVANGNDQANENEDIPQPDLPCGGADLMTDNLNCGTCGHECPLWYEGTMYEAGTCNAGVCGPRWAECTFGFLNCAEICAAFGTTCVSNGCSGYTGLLFGVNFGNGCDADEYVPEATLTGGCNEPIPWEPSGDFPREVMCCCDFQT